MVPQRLHTTISDEPAAGDRSLLPGVRRAVRAAASLLMARRAAGMSLAADLLIALIVAGWVALLVYSVRQLTGREVLALLPILVLTAVMQWYNLGQVYASGIVASISAVGSLAAGMLFGVPGAALAGTVSGLSLALSHERRRRPRVALFNTGEFSLTNAAGVACFIGVDRLIPGQAALMQVPGALLAGAVVNVTQCALVSAIVSLTTGRSARAVWEEHFRWMLPHVMVLGLLALGLALTYRAAGLAGLLAFTGPALLLRYAMKQYLDRTARSVEELRARNDELERANHEIAAMSRRLQQTYAGTLEALVAALDARDQETNGHSARVTQLTMVLARHMGVEEGSQQWIDIERGALLHDVGKIGVADAILRKPGALTDDEWAQMRTHARIGHEMLKDIPFLAGAAEIVACHHERWDGRGYPQGLAGEEIPFGARIFALADTFDAMATDRPYRKARSYEDCLAEITRCSGTQFDPAAVQALREIYPQWVELHRRSLASAGIGRLTVVA